MTKELLTVHQYCVSKVLQTGDDLGEVTETVDYNVQASTIAAGNLFGRYGPLLIESFSFVTLLLRSKFEIFDNVCLKKSDAFRLTGKEIYLVFNYSC